MVGKSIPFHSTALVYTAKPQSKPPRAKPRANLRAKPRANARARLLRASPALQSKMPEQDRSMKPPPKTHHFCSGKAALGDLLWRLLCRTVSYLPALQSISGKLSKILALQSKKNCSAEQTPEQSPEQTPEQTPEHALAQSKPCSAEQKCQSNTDQ